MKLIQMSEISCGEAGVVEGGWQAVVPRIEQIDTTSLRALTEKYEADGMGRVAAASRAMDTLQRVLESGWVAGLRQAIRRWALVYHERYGDLEGFDPRQMSVWYVPFDNTGRAGKPGAMRELERMRNDVE